jgi:LacI family transcriptional regulator
MRDVARVAGVSLSTVSRVVNGADVQEDLAARVHEAVQRLGYRRDHAASNLRRADRASGSIGLIFDDVSNPFFSAVQRGVEDVARERGVLAFAASSDADPGRERELVAALAERGVDGLIVVPSATDERHLRREREAGLAVVFVDRPARWLDADAVLSDNAGGARAAVAHLVAAGHRRIGFLGDREWLHTATERLRGYREALAAAGILGDKRLARLGLADSASGHAAVTAMMTSADPPTAVVTGQNLVTIGAVEALRALGLQHRVAMVGFDDVALADALDPAVTVVAQDPGAIGRAAAALLFSRLDGEHGPARRVVVATRLLPRGSGELSPEAAHRIRVGSGA